MMVPTIIRAMGLEKQHQPGPLSVTGISPAHPQALSVSDQDLPSRSIIDWRQSMGLPDSLKHRTVQQAVSRSLENVRRMDTNKSVANDHSQPDPTDRVHHHGWIVRKFLRRTSSTYNIKPRGIAPEIRRKRSVYTLSGIQPRPRKDILKDRTLEEISRLGGLSILTLPHDFAAVDKLVVPSCVSATAHYLVQHGWCLPGLGHALA